MLIHFSGMKNLDEAPVWVFPKLLVCLIAAFRSLSPRNANWLYLQELLRQVNLNRRE